MARQYKMQTSGGSSRDAMVDRRADSGMAAIERATRRELPTTAAEAHQLALVRDELKKVEKWAHEALKGWVREHGALIDEVRGAYSEREYETVGKYSVTRQQLLEDLIGAGMHSDLALKVIARAERRGLGKAETKLRFSWVKDGLE